MPVITAATTPVAPNVPRGVEMVEDSEDEHIGDGPAINPRGPLDSLYFFYWSYCQPKGNSETDNQFAKR